MGDGRLLAAEVDHREPRRLAPRPRRSGNRHMGHRAEPVRHVDETAFDAVAGHRREHLHALRHVDGASAPDAHDGIAARLLESADPCDDLLVRGVRTVAGERREPDARQLQVRPQPRSLEARPAHDEGPLRAQRMQETRHVGPFRRRGGAKPLDER